MLHISSMLSIDVIFETNAYWYRVKVETSQLHQRCWPSLRRHDCLLKFGCLILFSPETMQPSGMQDWSDRKMLNRNTTKAVSVDDDIAWGTLTGYSLSSSYCGKVGCTPPSLQRIGLAAYRNRRERARSWIATSSPCPAFQCTQTLASYKGW